MAASFPNSIWDGTTRSRGNFSVSRGPDGRDFDRISEEVIATQTYILNSIGGTVTTVSVNTDLSNGYQTVFVNATGGAIQIKLPDPSLQDISKIIVKKIDSSANAITVVPFDSETIDGGSSQVIGAQWDAMSVQTDLTDWFIV